jgi:hypothetical protein
LSYRGTAQLVLAVLALAGPLGAREPHPARQQKDYLTDTEANKIRDADTADMRIRLYISFAEDRLKKFEYEVNRKVPDTRRSEMLNALLNGYSGCVDDAADQIDVAHEKQMDIRDALKMMKNKDKDFLEILEKYDKDGPEFESYKDTLEDAIDGTKDAISDADQATPEATPGPVRRKP